MTRLQQLMDAIPDPSTGSFRVTGGAYVQGIRDGVNPVSLTLMGLHELHRRDAIIRAYHEAIQELLATNGDSLLSLRLLERFDKEFGQ